MAPPTDPPTTIELRVKVPPGSIPGGADEFTLGNEVPVSARIGEVRERIRRSIPSSPSPERQRLLYGGRALVDNEQTLADALNIKRDPSQEEYVIHLLVKGEAGGTAPSSHRRGMSTPNRSSSPAQSQANLPSNIQHQPLHHHPHQHIPQHAQQHQNAVNHAAVLAQQQGLQAQMQLNAGQNRLQPTAGLMPFGMQPMHFGQHMPVQATQRAVPAGNPQIAVHAQHDQPPQTQNAPGQSTTSSTDSNPQDRQRSEQANTGQPRDQPGNLDGAHGQQPGPHNPPRRPISNQGFHMESIGPNGQRITVHHQTLAFPGPPHMHMPPYAQMHGFPGPLQGMPPQPQARQHGTSALETARENIAESRRRLEALRAAHHPGAEVNFESVNDDVDQIERRMQALSDYIDPLRLGSMGNTQTRTASPRPNGNGHAAQPPINSSFLPNPGWQQRAQTLRQQQQQDTVTAGSDVTCYLLSSPTGPQAILYTPQHGAFQGSLSVQQGQTATNDPQPTPTRSATAGNGAPPEQAAQNQAVAAQPAPVQAQAAQQDPLGPLAPVMNHLWLLLRILIFSYFLLGANMGWRRPLALMAIGLGFWMIRMGLLAEGAAIRRWWDGIMNDNQRQPQGQEVQADGQGPQQQRAPPRLRPGQMPTPEQVAQRLLNEDARLRNDRLQRFRDYLRPVERAVALLIASLWPGVGEAYVRAREQEERRQAEEEIAARRQEAEEQQRKEEEEKRKVEGGSRDGEAPTENSNDPADDERTSGKAPATPAEGSL